MVSEHDKTVTVLATTPVQQTLSSQMRAAGFEFCDAGGHGPDTYVAPWDAATVSRLRALASVYDSRLQLVMPPGRRASTSCPGQRTVTARNV